MELVKEQFPIFKSQPRLVYLDSAATALKPQRVIDKVVEYYSQYSANINRGIYKLSEKATEEHEKARDLVAAFIGAKSSREVVFVRNATEAVNLVAYSWGQANLTEGDEIALTVMEHHANLVPWQKLAQEFGVTLRFLDIDEEGKLAVSEKKLAEWLTKKTKLVAFTQASNVLGTINDVPELVAQVRRRVPKALILVDGAQAAPHMPVSVVELGCDFYVFSGHKMYGPTGIGALWARKEILDEMPPFQFGGDMIEEVRLEGATFKEPPTKFEAGTPHIAGAIGMGEAVKFLEEIGMQNVREHEIEINRYALSKLGVISRLRILGPLKAEERSGLVSFAVEGLHAHDLAQILDDDNVAIRAGNHCAMPLHTRLGIGSTARASFGIYTSTEDIDRLVEGIEMAKKRLSFNGHP